MDTKSKNTNKNSVIRIIALTVSVILFFFSSLEICYCLRDAFYYNRSQTTGLYPAFSDTNTFRYNVNTCEYIMLAQAENRTCETEEDFNKTQSGKERNASIKQGCEDIRRACEFLDNVDNLDINVQDGMYRYHFENNSGEDYYYDYEGNFISKYSYYFGNVPEIDDEDIEDDEYIEAPARDEDTSVTMTTAPASTVNDASGEEPTTAADLSQKVTETTADTMFAGQKEYAIAKAIRMIWNLTFDGDDGRAVNYGEMSTDEIIEFYKGLNEFGDNFIYYDGDASVESTPGLRYAVFVNTTGKVYTNCDVKYSDDTKTVLKKLGADYFYEYSENGKYVSSRDGVPESESEFINALAGDLETPLKSLENREEIDRAYFGFTDTNSGPFLVGKMAYNGIANHGAHSPRMQIALLIVCLVISVAALVIYFVKCGITDSGDVKIRLTDRIPLIIRLVFCAGIIIALGGLVFGIHYYEFMFTRLFMDNYFPYSLAYSVAPFTSLICAALAAICLLVLASLIAGCVRNIRNKTFFRHTLLYTVFRIFRAIFRKFKGVHYKIKDSVTRLYSEDYTSKKGRKFLIFSAVTIAAFELVALLVMVIVSRHPGAILFGMILALLLGAYAALLAISFHRIATGVSKIKQGRFDTVIATKLMPPYMRATAEDITCVRDGIQSAVNQALKDQSMKTELITNVTHDLKTPLTSIISYVDLLKKEGLESENAPEYLNVIDEKSQKLKTLINDLVQASKASSGAMEVHYQTLDLCEFAMQIAGEYKEELKNSGIDTVVNCPDTPVYVSADPALVGRVFENLIGNIKKYAMKGTRAFITVSGDSNYGTMVFKNISASPLNIDSRKLTERFYRGDSSRSGEGSGLGLSIAKDLCTLQGGQFRLELDGDMFKAYVSLKAVNTQ